MWLTEKNKQKQNFAGVPLVKNLPSMLLYGKIQHNNVKQLSSN